MQTVGRITFIGDAKILSEDRIDWMNRFSYLHLSIQNKLACI